MTRFRVFQDAAGEWRWRLVAGNGRVIADSGEGYTRKEGAERAVARVKESVRRIAQAEHNGGFMEFEP